MSETQLTKDETDSIVAKIKTYFNDEFDQDIGSFEAEFLIDFFAEELGPYLYNQGLTDAHALLTEKTEELGYLIQDLEKPKI